MKWTPEDIDRATQAFPANLMPNWNDIPEEFKKQFGKWPNIVTQWFFHGIPKEAEFKPKEGVDVKKAIIHVGTIMRSFEPKHEHKEAACAFLLAEWFDDIVIPKPEPATK